MENTKLNTILNIVLGSNQYNQLLEDTMLEYKNIQSKDIDINSIIESYFIAILIIGFAKKQIDIDQYKIHLKNNINIKIDTKDFCKKYQKYINGVENFKLEMLRQLLS